MAYDAQRNPYTATQREPVFGLADSFRNGPTNRSNFGRSGQARSELIVSQRNPLRFCFDAEGDGLWGVKTAVACCVKPEKGPDTGLTPFSPFRNVFPD
jgi:hypothetical protein